MENPTETKEYKGYNINIFNDNNAESPRDWDNLGTMLCAHRRYALGDKVDFNSDNFNGWSEVYDYLIKDKEAVVILPLYLYDHSIVSISIGSFIGRAPHADWDSGQIGFIYIDRKKALSEFKAKRITSALKKRLEELLTSEVETYDKYLRGEVCGFKIEKNGEGFDSCWGFYSIEDAIKEAESQIDYYAKEEKALIPSLCA